MPSNMINIDGRSIGVNYPPYIIAELSANHNGDIKRAMQTITMAKSCGADAVKMQTYTADSLTIDCNNEDFQIHGGLWDGYNLYQLYHEAHTPYEWHEKLFKHAREIGITIFSTPFDEKAVDFLEELNTPAYKIASFEVTDLPLIKYVAEKGRPMIISTGMASLDEINDAVDVARSAGCEELVLLHCISAYPAPVEQSNLKTIADLSGRFGLIAGLSDHTLGTAVSVAAAALGACVIEKHVTLSRADKGPDSEFSLEPIELKRLCADAKDAWMSLGEVGYSRKQAEESSVKYRRSLYVVKDVKTGERFTKSNIRRIRPGFGLLPKYYQDILGKKSKLDLAMGTALEWEHVE